jgi:hypothetical protein
MPMYYFDLVESERRRVADSTGVEFDSLADARANALMTLCTMAIEDGRLQNIEIEIKMNPAGPVLCSVSPQGSSHLELLQTPKEPVQISRLLQPR